MPFPSAEAAAPQQDFAGCGAFTAVNFSCIINPILNFDTKVVLCYG